MCDFVFTSFLNTKDTKYLTKDTKVCQCRTKLPDVVLTIEFP